MQMVKITVPGIIRGQDDKREDKDCGDWRFSVFTVVILLRVYAIFLGIGSS